MSLLKKLPENEKIIIFAHHILVQKTLYETYGYKKAVWFRGDLKGHEQVRLEEKFRSNDEIQIAVTSFKACKEGVNLQAASQIIFTELDWSPANHVQGESRSHRQGQDKEVDVYYLIMENSYEEEVYELLQEKQQVIQALNVKKIDIRELLYQKYNRELDMNDRK